MRTIAGAAVIFTLMVLHKISIFPVEERQKAENSAEKSEEKGDIKALLGDKVFRRIVLAFVLWNIAVYSATPFFGAYQSRNWAF